jgi:hypothetical protein
MCRVDSKVQVDPKGRIVKVVVNGVPRSAPDFAGCVNVTLHDMAVPEWMLRLRPDKPSASTNEKTTPAGNALANPIVVFEVLVVLAELVIEREGVKVVLVVTLDMVAATAATVVTLRKRSEAERKCDTERRACLMTDLADQIGDIAGSSMCLYCYRVCMQNKGTWPTTIQRPDETWGSCNYSGRN